MAWRVANSLLKLRDQINSAVPNRSKINDGTIGDEAHASRVSDHNPWVMDGKTGVVTGLDITHDPQHGVDTYRLAETLRQQKDPRLKYVISNGRIFSFSISPWEWRPYHGSSRHDEHVHISVRPEKSLYDWDKPWNLGDFAPQTDAEPASEHPVLKYNDAGPVVGKLQNLLHILPELVPDDAGTATKLIRWIFSKQQDKLAPKYWFGPRTEKYVKDFQQASHLIPDGVVGAYTWRALEGSPATPQAQPRVNRNIVATVFGGSSDPNKSAYSGKLLNDKDMYVSLPYRFVGKRPNVKVTSRQTGESVIASIEDVGPWNTNDPYWTTAAGRPQSENGVDKLGRKTNHSGIDLSPAVARILQISGKGLVDWSFT